jgi:hypothetical protein
MSPDVVIGESASKPADFEAAPVPPLAIGTWLESAVFAGMLVNVFVEPEIDLLVRVSVVARPTKVSVEVGRVSVPVFEIVLMIGEVRVLFVSVATAAFFVASDVLSTLPRPTSPLTMPVGVVMAGEVSVLFVSVSVVALPTRVSVDVGRVSVPVLEIDEMTGEVRVLFVSVSVVARPTKVSGPAGSVSVPPEPVTTGVLIAGEVRVLFVRVSVVVRPTSVVVALGRVSTPPDGPTRIVVPSSWREAPA